MRCSVVVFIQCILIVIGCSLLWLPRLPCCRQRLQAEIGEHGSGCNQCLQ